MIVLLILIVSALLCEPAWTVTVVSSDCSIHGSCVSELTDAMGRGGEVALDGGVYHLNDTSLHASGPSIFVGAVRNLTVSGRGSSLVVHDLHGALSFAQSNNVVLHDVSFDMSRLPYTLATATAVSANASTLAYDASMYPFNPASTWLFAAQAILEYNTTGARPSDDGLDIYATPPSPSIAISGVTPTAFQLAIGARRGLRVGATYILRHHVYALNTIDGHQCVSFNVNNVSIFSAAGMGIVCSQCTDVTINRLLITKKDTTRPMSINADGIHLSDNRGTVRISDSVLSGQGDDGANINSRYSDVEHIHFDSNSITFGKDNSTDNPPSFVSVGDLILFRKRRSFVPFFSSKLTAIHNQSLFVFEDPLPATLEKFDLAVNMNNLPNLHVKNTTFSLNRARGILTKTHNVLIENCTFSYTTGPAIMAIPDGCHWFEGDTVRNWTVSGSRFEHNNYATAKGQGAVTLGACVPQWQNGVPLPTGGTQPMTRGQQQHSDLHMTQCQFDIVPLRSAVSAIGVSAFTVDHSVVHHMATAPSYAPEFSFANSVLVSVDHTNVCFAANHTQIECQVKL